MRLAHRVAFIRLRLTHHKLDPSSSLCRQRTTTEYARRAAPAAAVGEELAHLILLYQSQAAPDHPDHCKHDTLNSALGFWLRATVNATISDEARLLALASRCAARQESAAATVTRKRQTIQLQKCTLLEKTYKFDAACPTYTSLTLFCWSHRASITIQPSLIFATLARSHLIDSSSTATPCIDQTSQ
ncbi:hypothetical protein K437DRAFT_67991 [Tilletiaria anomala UBC 951]|uniref:Uncharacterized protein n=1 Tax=Tilletiaria anomala (strain ATCC 24038 / CBS 436.72 / UBC 951) TaxID=1037660 RepID=A0A066V6A8_TILAU|nr:uncharacterized protein K437DRAFT_67991 [Tilletiaria anomala UBC 951]KDN35778.1 hypothetical protein K437DRAFT_67991 [Tilletiaria anomala UBC 951]